VAPVTPQSPLALHAASPVELKQRLEAERRGTPFLVYRDDQGAQRMVELTGDGARVTVGRRPSSDVPLAWDDQVSRLHAELEQIGRDWTVRDDGLSRNGTFVNGVRVSGRRRLRDGDTLRFGETLVVFRAPGDQASRVTTGGTEIPTVGDLSETQLAVLRALCRPFKDAGAFATPATNQEIAAQVYLSVDAVKTHLRSLFRKFGVGELPQNQKRAQLVARAFAAGVVAERDL
jgi:DNA-binding CsgD family transcriptional regulator